MKHLKPFGYSPVPFSLSLWTHISKPTKFCLCVDDFGLKYFSIADANHLLTSLKSAFKVSVDWEGKNYCGLTLQWNYEKGYVDVSMPGYVPKMLNKSNHPKPSKPQHAPHTRTTPQYGLKRQYAKVTPNLPILPDKLTNLIQQKVGSILYYSRAIETPALPALT